MLLMPLWAAAFSPKSIPSKINSPMSANNNQQGLNSQTAEFMTMRDMTFSTPSNVSIQNIDVGSITVTGIYISNLTSNPTDCTTGTLLDSVGNPYGAMWSPQVTVAPLQTKSIGANYLYNMIMLFLYGAYVEGHAAQIYTPGHAEDGNKNWCLYLGITNEALPDGLACSTCALNPFNILVYSIPGDLATSFTNITCDDARRVCSTNNTIPPQPFPHQP